MLGTLANSADDCIEVLDFAIISRFYANLVPKSKLYEVDQWHAKHMQVPLRFAVHTRSGKM